MDYYTERDLIHSALYLFFISMFVTGAILHGEGILIFLSEVKENKDMIQETRRDYIEQAKSLDDCKKLNKLQLKLIDMGADSTSWAPDYIDRALKIAEKRSPLICEDQHD